MQDIDFKKIKLIILDIDNTLTNSKLEISEYAKKIIKEIVDMGIKVVLCSGRTTEYTVEKSKLCNASSLVISDNGTIIYDYKEEKVYKANYFSNDILEKIIAVCQENNVDYVFNAINGRYRHKDNKHNEYIKNINLIESLEDIPEKITQIVINSKRKSSLKKCYELIKSINDIKITNTNLYSKKERGYYFCDINIKGVSKGVAINYLMNIFNIKENEIICFGDSMNDYTMFEATKYFIAMKNADEKLKEKAYMITEYDHDNDGVAKCLSKHILNK